MAGPLIALDATLAGGTSTGDSAYWTGLLTGLAEVAHDFRFLLLSDAAPPRDVALPEDRFRWIRLPRRPARWFSLVTMPLAARRLGASVFHTQYNLSPLARNGVTTIHDVSFFIGPEWFKPRDRFLLRRFVAGSARRAVRVITVSEASKGDIVRFLGVPEEKVVVTYNAPHPRFRPVSEDERRPVLERLGVTAPYLLTVGTRWPRKNMALAVKAAALLPEDLPHRLVITGKPGWGEEGGGPRLHATGYLADEDMPALYSGASLYLCPSHYEGFGIPVVEAFACGTPVITSPGGGLREVAGDAAEVMEEMTPEAWAERIRSLLADSSNLAAMRERGLRRAQGFSWADTARRTVQVYREAAL
ncbi:MAG: glycosyltransferase family 4 protein [Armatimonadetes bacterium]|nr:glycosyltransferase family 4 protein [Armatimonadota bacterium]